MASAEKNICVCMYTCIYPRWFLVGFAEGFFVSTQDSYRWKTVMQCSNHGISSCKRVLLLGSSRPE